MMMNTEHELPTDWREIKREADSFLPEKQLKYRPGGLPPGVNFVTPEWLGYWEAEDGSGAEVTTGIMLGGRQLGLTFPRVRSEQGTWLPDERDRMCWNWTEVRVALGYGDGQP